MSVQYRINFKTYQELPTNEPGIPAFPANIARPLVSKKWWLKFCALKSKLENQIEGGPLRPRGRPKKQCNKGEIVEDVVEPAGDIGNLPDEWWEGDDWVPESVLALQMSPCQDSQMEENKIEDEIQETTQVEVRQVGNRTIIKKYECQKCNKKFSAKSTLKYHMRIHNREEMFWCNDCGLGFVTKYQLKIHTRKHKTADLIICWICGRGFVTTELLKVHIRSHTGDKPHICDVPGCDKRFTTSSNLNQHKETHDKIKKYLCLQCGAGFSQKRCFHAHMTTHSEKIWECAFCEKKWTRKKYVIEHMRVHTGDKPYECQKCHKKFTQGSSYRRHMNNSHMDKANQTNSSVIRLIDYT